MQKRALGPFSVGRIGLGCMNLDHGYGPAASEADGQIVANVTSSILQPTDFSSVK